MIKGGDHVTDEDADADKDQWPVMGDVQNSITIGRNQRNSHKPNWLTTNMIVAYVLPLVEEAIPSTYRKAEISSEFKIWKDVMMKDMISLHKNDTGELIELPKGKKGYWL